MRVSGLRWPIESCFEQAKGSLGMAAYQTRSWRGGGQHTTPGVLAHPFLVGLTPKHKKGDRRSPWSRRAVS